MQVLSRCVRTFTIGSLSLEMYGDPGWLSAMHCRNICTLEARLLKHTTAADSHHDKIAVFVHQAYDLQ